MIRLHNDTIMDLSGAAAQYAITVANTILERGEALSTQISEWEQLDNEAITVFNNLYDEVKDDKDAVELLLEEVRSVSQDAYDYKIAAQSSATSANAAVSNARQAKNEAQQYRDEVVAIKDQTTAELQEAEQFCQNAMRNARSYVSSAEQSATSAQESAAIASQKEGIVSEILTSHANIIEITNEDIDDIWNEDYAPEDESDEVDGDGIYDLPIPIPKIQAMFGGD